MTDDLRRESTTEDGRPMPKIEDNISFQGMSIAIENKKGSKREWYDVMAKKKGYTTMTYPYGYIQKTQGVDGDKLDVYVGDNKDADTVYVIHQMKTPEFKKYDEDKCMIGFDSAKDAKKAYLAHYDNPKFLGSMTEMPMDEFKKKAYKTLRSPQMVKSLPDTRHPKILDKKRKQAVKGHTHPLAYDWHDGHTVFHGDLKKSEHPHTSIPEPKQTGGVKKDTYTPIAKKYGSIVDGFVANLKHYPDLDNHEHKVDSMIAKHGYSTYFAGNKFGKPDLANKNYDTKHLMVFDPTPKAGGDFGEEGYTRSWRKIHELSHALTKDELNNQYGEGRRLGKLGIRSSKEATRAVHWEWLAVHKQRALSAEMGIHVTDGAFHKEVNTVMHDAVHRAIHGKFTEPSEMGYIPSDQKVPLETSLKAIGDHAKSIGLTHEDMTNKDIKKSLGLFKGIVGHALSGGTVPEHPEEPTAPAYHSALTKYFKSELSKPTHSTADVQNRLKAGIKSGAIKQEEVEYSKLDQFFEHNPHKVNPSDLHAHIQKHNPMLEDVWKKDGEGAHEGYQLSGPHTDYKELVMKLPDSYGNDNEELYRKAHEDHYEASAELDDLYQHKGSLMGNHPEMGDRWDEALKKDKEFDSEAYRKDNENHPIKLESNREWERHVEKKERKHRDVVEADWLKHPDHLDYLDKRYEAVKKVSDTKSDMRELASPKPFQQTAHYDELNPVAHGRGSTRIDHEGAKVFHVGEIQSDWHQEGLAHGYGEDGDVPDAPHKKTWHKLMFNRLVRHAVETGHDKITWTTGEQQNERYGLHNHLSKITGSMSTKEDGSKIYDTIAHVKDGSGSQGVIGDEKKLSQYYGKDVAKKLTAKIEERGDTQSVKKEHADKYLNAILDKFGGKDSQGREGYKAFLEQMQGTPDLSSHVSMKKLWRGHNERIPEAEKHFDNYLDASQPAEINGDDLRGGGHGMRSFYDEKIPNHARKEFKKHGATVGHTYLDDGHGFESGDNVSPHETKKDYESYSGIVKLADTHPSYDKEEPWAHYTHEGVALRQYESEAEAEEGLSEVRAETKDLKPIQPRGHKVHSMDITPELRHHALHEGFPVFSKSFDDISYENPYTDFLKAIEKAPKEKKVEEEYMPSKFDHGTGLKDVKGRRMKSSKSPTVTMQRNNNRRKIASGSFTRPPYEDEA